jgi:hypothetical protein
VETRALAMPSSREIMGSISTRVPVSMIQELNDVCAARGIDQSPLVRHFIAAGLRSLPPFDGKSSK